MFKKLIFISLLIPSLLFGEPQILIQAPEKIVSLAQIAKSIEDLKIAEEIETNPEQIKLIKSEIEDLEYDFIEVATGLDLTVTVPAENKVPFSWSQELYTLLSPIINELKEVSKRPRELQTIRDSLLQSESNLEKASKLIADFQSLKKETSDPLLEKYLSTYIKKWSGRTEKIETEVTILKQRLASRLAEKKSIGDSISNLFDIFFKNRGKNFTISILSCVLFILLLRAIYQFSYQKILRSQNLKKDFRLKLLSVSYLFSLIFGTLLLFSGILFLLEDWLLLLATGLIVLAILWSTRQIIPRFWMETVLILNSGPVREKERLDYQGIPYKVRKINFNSYLINPELEGGVLRLPLKDLIELRSRPACSEEVWFPTKKHDWIYFPERNLHAQVIFQSPTNVILQNLGGSKISFLTTEFLGEHFLNLSNGFRISIIFGLDYKHQQLSTNVIPKTFKLGLEKKLASSKLKDIINKLTVELGSVSLSSLDMEIIADCDGKGAKDYQKIKRLISRLSVEICNEENYTIPFPQMNVHLSNRE